MPAYGNDAVKRIVIADDHEVVRSGLRAIVETRPNWTVSGEASNGEQAVALTLETRPDIDRDRLAFYGLSAGAVDGPILTALEPRFKASILVSGGFPTQSEPPEADPINFAPRAKMPVLMLNGRHDFALPIRLRLNRSW